MRIYFAFVLLLALAAPLPHTADVPAGAAFAEGAGKIDDGGGKRKKKGKAPKPILGVVLLDPVESAQAEARKKGRRVPTANEVYDGYRKKAKKQGKKKLAKAIKKKNREREDAMKDAQKAEDKAARLAKEIAFNKKRLAKLDANWRKGLDEKGKKLSNDGLERQKKYIDDLRKLYKNTPKTKRSAEKRARQYRRTEAKARRALNKLVNGL